MASLTLALGERVEALVCESPCETNRCTGLVHVEAVQFLTSVHAMVSSHRALFCGCSRLLMRRIGCVFSAFVVVADEAGRKVAMREEGPLL